MITAVTTCMGRREHLETTLPMMLEEFDRVVVVDWSCPQNSGEWAASEGASVIYKYGEKYFGRSASKNYGAGVVNTDYLAFVDADTMCMAGLGNELRSLLDLETMVFASRTTNGQDVENLFGFIACPLKSFLSVGGYDESFNGWGHEDSHLRGKLLLDGGLKPKRVSPIALMSISHPNELRDENHAESMWQTSHDNFQKLYKYFASKGIEDWMLDPRTRDITFVKRDYVRP